MTFCDAHLHLMHCRDFSSDDWYKKLPEKYRCCSCAHDKEEFSRQFELISGKYDNVVHSFGLHPQNPDISLLDFLEELLKEDKISAIGETGIDLFESPFKENRKNQIKAWHACLELAVEYKKTIVVHNRKALDQMFRDIQILKKVPCIVFHSFAFSSREAFSLLDKGLNAYFSFGKPLINGNKKSISCIKDLPLEKLLLETDAPFQTLKGEEFTSVADIKKVYETASLLRECDLGDLCPRIEENFINAFNVRKYKD